MNTFLSRQAGRHLEVDLLVVKLLLEVCRVFEVLKVESNYVHNAQTYANDEGDPPENAISFFGAVLFCPGLLKRRQRTSILLIMNVLNHLINPKSVLHIAPFTCLTVHLPLFELLTVDLRVKVKRLGYVVKVS